MYILENVTLNLEEDNKETLARKVSERVGYTLKSDELEIWKRSFDTRSKNNLHYVYSVVVPHAGQAKDQCRFLDFSFTPSFPDASHVKVQPVVVGFGPAGIFAAYYLASCGLKPLVLERGAPIELRQKAVESFWQGQADLDPENNVQFGEGGAGTFSDGKLTSRSKDLRAKLIRKIFVEHGAPPCILYEAKAHIGTDRLRSLIPKIRQTIENLGGKVCFGAKVESLVIKNHHVVGVKLADGTVINTSVVILAIGHSARDTFEMLYTQGISLEPKTFAAGFRIEHPQELINEIVYGKHNLKKYTLPPAEYTLAETIHNRGCYSFCMCPGGSVINASSELHHLVINGMSESARNQAWANSALVVTVLPQDFYQNSPLDGIFWQRAAEKKAYRAQNVAPACFWKDLQNPKFLSKKSKINVESSYRPSLEHANLTNIYPSFILETLFKASHAFEKKMPKFLSSNPILIAPETRTSSPVRIVRHPESLQSSSCQGLFPAGEGAGYAGGIMSAAVDGWKAAEVLVRYLLESCPK